MFTDADTNRADWLLLQSGAINLFWRKTYYDETKRDLAALGYRILDVPYMSYDQFILDLSEAVGSSWDGNLDALNDDLSPFSFIGTNTAICISRFQALMSFDARLGLTLLQIIEDQSRCHLLFGQRLIALIQTDDADFRSGATSRVEANWNYREWIDANRGV